MDKLKLTALNLGRVFNYSFGRACMYISKYSSSKQPDLKLKTQPKPVLGSLPFAFVLPANLSLYKHWFSSVLTFYWILLNFYWIFIESDLISVREAHDFDAVSKKGSVEKPVKQKHLTWKIKKIALEWRLRFIYTSDFRVRFRIKLAQSWEQRPVCWTPKSDLSSTTKCDQNLISGSCKFGRT